MIYTKTGDQGTTSLPTGERVEKHAPRICFYGMLDELSSRLGLLASLLREQSYLSSVKADIVLIENVQQILFRWASLPQPVKSCHNDVTLLEHSIDEIHRLVSGIFKGFVLPGGTVVAAETHIVRCSVRRFERELYALLPEFSTTMTEALEETGAFILINRLSDYLYALARKINYLTGYDEKKAQL